MKEAAMGLPAEPESITAENERRINKIAEMLDGLQLEEARTLLWYAEQRISENAYVNFNRNAK